MFKGITKATKGFKSGVESYIGHRSAILDFFKRRIYSKHPLISMKGHAMVFHKPASQLAWFNTTLTQIVVLELYTRIG
ncbi:hypothetical protein D3C87_859280 [compost metagenome]